MKTRKFIKKVVVSLGVSIFLLLLVITHYFWSNAGNFEKQLGVGRYGVIRAMAKLKFSTAKYAVIDRHSTTILTRSEPQSTSLDVYMKAYGWNRVDQMGSIYYYSKDKQHMAVKHLAMTRFFKLNKLEYSPYLQKSKNELEAN